MKSWINWTDGMRLNASHFSHLQEAVQTRINYSNSLLTNEYAYGFVPKGSIQDNQFLKYENGEIIILGYSGITAAGTWIYFDEPISFSPLSEGYIEIEVVAKAYSTYGEEIPEVNHKKLYLRENIESRIVLKPSFGSSVVVGRYTKEGIDTNFIPACLYWDDLRKYSTDANNLAGQETEIKKICLKYLQPENPENKPNSRVKKEIAFDIMNYINTCSLFPNITPFDSYKKARYLSESIKLMNIKNSFDHNIKIQIEEMLDYSSLNQKALFSAILNMYHKIALHLSDIFEKRKLGKELLPSDFSV